MKTNPIITAILPVLLFCLGAFAQPQLNQTDKAGKKQGPWKKTYENGVTRYEGAFKNNNPVGRFIHYYPSGKLKSHTDYQGSAGKKCYTVYFFEETGKKMGEGIYISEKRDSIWTYYNAAGKVVLREPYTAGKKNGISISYYENGQKLEEQGWKNDEKHGIWKTWFEDGKVKSDATYVDGELDGKIVFNYPSGLPETIGHYRSATRDGIWMTYNQDGTTKIREVWANGYQKETKFVTGVDELYTPDGILLKRFTYKDGKKNGPFEEYHDGAKKIIETRPGEDGFPEEKVEVTVDHKIKRKGNFKEDQLDGEVIYYNKNGKLDKVEVYQAGKLVGTK